MKSLRPVVLFCLICISGCSIPTNLNLEKTDDKTKLKTESKDYPVLNNYDLSLDFMKNLKSYVTDKVLNKNEINLLAQNTVSDTEKKFLNILKDKQSFIMTNLKEKDDEADDLSFIVNKDFDIDGKFLKIFYKANEGNVFTTKQMNDLLDKSNLDEKNYLNKIGKYDSYNILLLDQNENIQEQKLNLYYDENQVIAGNNPSEIVANIGQNDRLEETKTDNYRCGSAVIINAILLLKGEKGFYTFSEKMGLHFNSLTYNNVHVAQDMLMKKVDSAEFSLSISYGDNGSLFSGTFLQALTYSGIKWEDKLIKKENDSFKNDIENYFTNSPKSALIASVSFDRNSGKLDFRKFPNHYVLITFKDGKYYITNSANRNGTASNTFQVTHEQLSYMFYSKNIFIKISA